MNHSATRNQTSLAPGWNLLLWVALWIPPMLSAGDAPVIDDKNPQAESAPASAEEATLFPIPDYSGDLLSRSFFTGDWGGARTAIAEKGIQVKVDNTQFYQGVIDGGFDERWEYSGVNDYRILFDSSKAGLWPGGFIEVHGETYWGNVIGRSDGAVLPSNFSQAMSQPAGNGTYLSHVVVTQFLSERFAITGGKIDTSAGDANAFAHGIGREGFMNAAFGLNPVTYYTSPYSTLGGGFIYLLGDQKQHFLNVMAYDGDGQIDRAGFDTVFEGNTTYAAALRLQTNFFEKTGHQWFGFLYGSGDYLAAQQDPRVLIPALDLPPAAEDETWAFFYNFDQTLVSHSSDPTQGWGIFGRFGIADEDTNVLRTFYSAGIGGTGLIPGRDRDRSGIGYFYQKLSDQRLGLLTDDDEQGVEVYHQVAVTPCFDLTIDLQVIDGAVKRADTAWIGGIRGRIAF